MNTAIENKTADPRPFMQHMELARKWAKWNGQQGTERQILRIMRQIDAPGLYQMLKAREVEVD